MEPAFSLGVSLSSKSCTSERSFRSVAREQQVMTMRYCARVIATYKTRSSSDIFCLRMRSEIAARAIVGYETRLTGS